MTIDDLLSKKISYQNQYWKEVFETDIKTVLEEIKGNKHENYTKYLRELYTSGQSSAYGIKKRTLPVATFCGTFHQNRTKECLSEYNSILILDIDELGAVELERVKNVLANDEYVFAFWESPSKDGIKGLVHLKFNNEYKKSEVDQIHKTAFVNLFNYFKENYSITLDKSGNDFTRLCFISWDENIVLKTSFRSYEINEIEIQEILDTKNHKLETKTLNSSNNNILFNPIGKNNQYQKQTILKIISYLKKKSLSITYDYDDWFRVAFAIANTFTFDIGLKYFNELSKLDTTKFNEYECENFLKNCYEYSKGKIQFGLIINLSKNKGFKYKNINTEST